MNSARSRGFPLQAAFPLVGNQVHPSPEDYPSPEAFRRRVLEAKPDWLYHLAIRKRNGQKRIRSTFELIEAEWLEELAESLQIDAGKVAPLELYVNEYVSGELIEVPNPSPWAVEQPLLFDGTSYKLAAAVLLAATAWRRGLPPSIIYSGQVDPGNLGLGAVTHLLEKVQIALGNAPHRGDGIRRTVERMFVHAQTQSDLGPRKGRSVPGEVRLMVIPRSSDELAKVAERFTVADIDPDALAESLGDARGPQVPRRIVELTGAGPHSEEELVLACASHFTDVLALLGIPSPSDGAAHDLAKRLTLGSLKLHRIRPAARPQGEPRPLEHRYRDEIQVIADRLRRRAEALHPDPGRWFAVDVAMRQPGDVEERLQVLVRSGAQARAIPDFYPANVGISQVVLVDGAMQAVERIHDNPHFRAAISSQNPLHDHQDYLPFLRGLGACVKAPLVEKNYPIGVLSVHTNLPVDRFAPDLLGDMEVAAQSLGGIVAEYQGLVFTDRRAEIEGALRRCEAQKVPLDRLLDELHRLARKLFGAHRAIIRLYDPVEGDLRLLGDPNETGYPSESAQRALRLDRDGDTGIVHAFQSRTNCYIRDTLSLPPGWPFRPVPPKLSRSYAALLLREGTHIFGVLGIGWETPQQFDRAQADLEHLAREAARRIRPLLVFDNRIPQIGTILQEASSRVRGGAEDPPRLFGERALKPITDALPIIRSVIGAETAVLYLRDPEDGWYRAAAWDGHDEPFVAYLRQEMLFDRQTGLIGWIVRHQRLLNVKDHKNWDELRRIEPRDPPRWKYFDQFSPRSSQAYLGVPIRLDNETLGVMRFMKEATPHGFSKSDELSVRMIAETISSYLDEAYTKPVLAAAFRRLYTVNAIRATREAVAAEVIAALRRALGDCSCSLRLLDRIPINPEGTPGAVLRHLAASDPSGMKERSRYRFDTDRTPTVQAWLQGHPVIIPVMSQADDLPYDPKMVEFLRRCGALACYPLKDLEGTLVGTLRLTRPERFTLSSGDESFLAQIAQMAGLALHKAAEEEMVQFELDATRAALTFAQDPGALVAEVFRLVVAAAGGDPEGSVAWLPDAPGRSLTARDAAGGGPIAGARVPLAQIEGEVGRQGWRAVVQPVSSFGLETLLPGGEPADRQRAAVTFRDGGEGLLAIFLILAPPGPSKALDCTRLEAIQHKLDHLGALMSRGRGPLVRA